MLLKKNPTQACRVSLARCEHGYYIFSQKLRTPRCPHCNREAKKNNLTGFPRVRTHLGRFSPINSVVKGHYLCSQCRQIKPLSEFRGDATKATGKQSRCSKCDNRLKTRRMLAR